MKAISPRRLARLYSTQIDKPVAWIPFKFDFRKATIFYDITMQRFYGGSDLFPSHARLAKAPSL